jgi:predicted GIY-YIG superfamily endonuclease
MSVAARARRARRPVVYLVHFTQPYRHARHYVGYTKDLPSRLEEHRTGSGARLLAAVAAAGIPFEVVWIWHHSSRSFERRVHQYKNTPKLCPICMNTDRHARRYASRRAEGVQAQ